MPKSKVSAQDEKALGATADEEPATLAVQVKSPSKLDLVIALLRRDEGATIEELMTSTGWQAHSVRGALAGAIKKKLGSPVQSAKEGNCRVYRVVGAGS